MRFFFPLLLLANIVCAQTREADSLFKLLQGRKDDTTKVNILNRLAKILEDKKPARSLELAKEAYAISGKLNFPRGKAMALIYHADFYYFQGIADSAEKKYEEAIVILRSINAKDLLGMVYMVAGNNFTNDGRYEKAIEYVLKSVEINQEINNMPGYAWALQTAGGMFTQLGVLDKADEYTQKALTIMEKLNNTDGIASCYNTLGIINDYSGNFEKALEYYTKALALREQTHNLVEAINIKANMGVIYLYMGNFNKSITYLKDAMRLARQEGQSASVASALINLGEAYTNSGNFTLALSSLREGIALADTIGVLEYKQEGVRLLAEVLFAAGNYKEALQQQQLYSAIKDSILKVSGTQQIFEMNTRYESAQKDKALIVKDAEISKQSADSRQKSLQRNSFILGFGLMLVLSFFIFRGYRENQKINAEITKQKHLIEEKQKEVLDSIHYARRIQRALITPEKYIEKVLKKYV